MDLAAFLPILLMVILGVGFAVAAMSMSWWMAPRNPTPEKLAPYECGIVPLQEPVERFPVKFYLVAVSFIIFDVEAVFLFPWAVVFDELGLFAFVEGLIFIAILVLGLAYLWAKGDLEWIREEDRAGSASSTTKVA